MESSEIPDCDVIIGGFPCQSFSTVNPTKNPFDERANLYKQMVRIVKDKQPQVFIAENVKGLMTLHKGEIFKKIYKALEAVSYTHLDVYKRQGVDRRSFRLWKKYSGRLHQWPESFFQSRRMQRGTYCGWCGCAEEQHFPALCTCRDVYKRQR